MASSKPWRLLSGRCLSRVNRVILPVVDGIRSSFTSGQHSTANVKPGTLPNRSKVQSYAVWGHLAVLEGVRLHGENAREGTRWEDRFRHRCSVRHWTGDRNRLRPGGGESHALRH